MPASVDAKSKKKKGRRRAATEQVWTHISGTYNFSTGDIYMMVYNMPDVTVRGVLQTPAPLRGALPLGAGCYLAVLMPWVRYGDHGCVRRWRQWARRPLLQGAARSGSAP